MSITTIKLGYVAALYGELTSPTGSDRTNQKLAPSLIEGRSDNCFLHIFYFFVRFEKKRKPRKIWLLSGHAAPFHVNRPAQQHSVLEPIPSSP